MINRIRIALTGLMVVSMASCGGGGASSSSSSNSSSSSSSTSSSSSSSSGALNLSAGCSELISDPSINWRESSLQTDQEIVECLSYSLGTAIGFGENAKGGYDSAGDSQLVVIKTDAAVSVEEQIFNAVSNEQHNWIVFDKNDFSKPVEIAMYRLHCGNSAVQSALGGASEAECVDYKKWCSNNGVSEEACAAEFFNERLNDSSLPIRNTVIGSNTTIDGRMSQAVFRFNGFAIGKDSSGAAIQTATSVILTHLNFQGAGHTEDHDLDPDMIRSTGESHDIWIHKNTFDLTGDSAFDVKVGAYDVTMSFNRVFDVKRSTLHGSSDSRTINSQITTTMHHNAFITRDNLYFEFGNTARRVPLLRRGTAHIFNNVFMNYRKDIFSIRVGGYLGFDNNILSINNDFQEKSSLADSLSELEGRLFDVRDGALDSSGTKLWFNDSDCNLLGDTVTDMSSHSEGSSRDLFNLYNANSQQVINAEYKPAGQQLADYIYATAGINGAVPFSSPLALSQAEVINQYPAPCQ